MEIAPPHTDAADIEFTGHADRHGLALAIENVHTHVENWAPNRHVDHRFRWGFSDKVMGHIVGAFGGAIGVD